MRLKPLYVVPILTLDENERFTKILLYLEVERYRRHLFVQLDYDPSQDPYTYLYFCAQAMGYNLFAEQLVRVTLEIYHEAREWLPLFYSAALLTAENNIDLIVEELNSMPPDLSAFIVAILVEIDLEMRQQIATDFAHMPYDLPDYKSTREYFQDLYGRARIKFAALIERLAQNRLL
jgi:hypothetical protein